MARKNTKQQQKVLFLFLILICILLMFTGCQSEKKSGIHAETMHHDDLAKGAIPPSFTGQEVSGPIPIDEGQFNTVSGWLNNETIIYITNVGLGSHVYTYNIFTGGNHLIFESEDPVAAVTASPSGERLFIHTVPNTYEGVITIIDKDGNEVMSERIEAFDFVFEWNPYDENVLLLSLFTEDWDFSAYQLNLEEKKMTSVQLKEPFAHWVSKDEVVYLDWSQQHPSLFAPLIKKSIFSENDQTVMDEVFYVKAMKDIIMTITVTSDKIKESAYSFLSSDFKEISSMSIPHLTRFSDWLIPYFDFDENHALHTFAPLYSSEADTYGEGFQLLSFDIRTGEKSVILEDLENEPISCSPNGKHCLYGFYLEKLINMDTKEIMPMIDQ